MPIKTKNIDLIMPCAGSQGKIDKSHVPLGLIYVGSSLASHGYYVKIWHLLPEEFNEAVTSIKKRRPLWVGISVLSGMTTLHAATISLILKKELPETPVIWGGHHPSAVPEDCLRETYIDLVVIGEGEITAVELSDALLNEENLAKIMGIGYKDESGNKIINESRPLIKDLDNLELRWDLINLQDYCFRWTNGKAPISFYSSRGCPFKCAFCSTPSYTGSIYRAHSPEYVVSHLSFLKRRYGFNSVFFADDNFMLQQKRGSEIITRLSSKGISVDTVDIRLNQMDDDILKMFKYHNVTGIFFGYESANNRILKLINKGIDLNLIKEKTIKLNEYNISVWASGIIGFPTETRDELYQTIDFSNWLRDNLPSGSVVSIYRYMPLPKTKLLELALQEGFIYPKTSIDWRKIDPIGPYYSMSEWIKWITPEDERYFALVQELSRNKMLNYISHKSTLVNYINNLFVFWVRKQIKMRNHKWSFVLNLFDFARNTYSIIRYGRITGYKSQAIKRRSLLNKKFDYALSSAKVMVEVLAQAFKRRLNIWDSQKRWLKR